MFIPTEPIGSIPRPPELLDKIRDFHAKRISVETLQTAYDNALRDTIESVVSLRAS
jgi:5-methyltetrahydropteroyltriglutamate--homocysteine methyltransferase